MIEQPYHETLLTWWAAQDVEGVERQVQQFDDVEQAKRIRRAFLEPAELWSEGDALLATMRHAALGDGGSLAGLTVEQIAAEVAEINRRVIARRPVS